MISKEIRKSFLEFFKDKNHKFSRSSSVVPSDDPTLLFTNAGMNQFKPIFLDQLKPTNLRVVNSQNVSGCLENIMTLKKLESILFIIPFLKCWEIGPLEIITKENQFSGRGNFLQKYGNWIKIDFGRQYTKMMMRLSIYG